MELTLADRLSILVVLPEQGSFDTLKIVHDLKMALSPSEEEIEKFGIVSRDNMVLFRPDVEDVPKEIEIGPAANKIIVDALETLNKQEALTQQSFHLYQRFVLGEEGDQ